MAHSKRIATLASAAAPAGGTILAGAGAAGAQGSSEVANDLQLASIALNGPVSVSPNAEGGPTVAYTNEGDATQQCIGFTAPYSTIEENDIDPREINPNSLGSLGVLGTIQGGGGVSVLTVSPPRLSVDPDSIWWGRPPPLAPASRAVFECRPARR
ncbi:hypothetical protein ACWIFB_07950 [Dietzia sp. NPDC055340]